MTDMEHFDRLVELWAERLTASSRYNTGYFSGRFDQYAVDYDLHGEVILRAQETARLRVEILAGRS